MTTISTRRTAVPLPVLAVAFLALTVLGGALGPTTTRPDSAPADVLAALTAGAGRHALGSVALLGSAMALIAVAATMARRLAAGSAAGSGLCLVAGAVAATFLAASAVIGWTAAATTTLGDASLTAVLAFLWFATGGVGVVAPFGLLLVAVAVTAPIPRPLGWATGAVGGLCVLTIAAPALPVLYPLLPVGRFGGGLLLIATSIVVARAGATR